jgi:DNA-binding CsgD family transcriptional regulator
VLAGRAYLLAFAGRPAETVRTAREALALAEDVGDASAAARALFAEATAEVRARPAQMRRLYERARELARESGDEWCFATASCGAGISYAISDDHDDAWRMFGECLPIVERRGDQEWISWALLGMSLRYRDRDLEKFFELAERSAAAARAVGQPGCEASAQAVLARGEVAVGQAERALKRVVVHRRRVIAAGAGHVLHEVEVALAVAKATLGDLDAAQAGLEAVVAGGADLGWLLAWALLELATITELAGDRAAAERHASVALEIGARIGSRNRCAWAKEILGRLAVRRGDWDEARALLHEALDISAKHHIHLRTVEVLDGLAELAAGLADHDEAARLLGAAHRARADLGIVRWDPHQPRFDELERDLHAELGDERFSAVWREGAELSLSEAVAWVQRDRGTGRRPPGGWESLTPTELEVARHAAAGLTNSEIGEAMFISPATVRTHLSHIYAKLGVRNRAELTARAARQVAVG